MWSVGLSKQAKLRIGVDGFNLAMARGTGVATYARTLTQAIRRFGGAVDVLYGLDVPRRASLDVRESLFFAALGEGRSGGEPPTSITFSRAVRRAFLAPGSRDLLDIPVTGRVLNQSLADRLPAYDRLFSLPSLFYLATRHFRRYGRFMDVRIPNPPDIMHWTYPLPLRLLGARNVYTIHDLVPLRLPFTSLDDRLYYDRLIRKCLQGADHICTVSETSRRDVMQLFDMPPERITNTYQAVDGVDAVAELDEVTLAASLRRLFDLEVGSYFLHFGAIEPKKNLGRLIEAYLIADLKTPLVIAGPRAWKADGELRLLEGAHGVRLKGADTIRLIDYLPRAYLLTLVRGAKAVLFPSLYEGFGLPALEAMALGTALMTSTGGALPEIVADAALTVDPYDRDAMAQALMRLETEPALRARLASAGRARAEHFSLGQYAARLDLFYSRVLQQPAPHGSLNSSSIADAAL